MKKIKSSVVVFIGVCSLLLVGQALADGVVWMKQGDCGILLSWNRDPLFDFLFIDEFEVAIPYSFADERHHARDQEVAFPAGLGKKVHAEVNAYYDGEWIGSDSGDFVNNCGVNPPPVPTAPPVTTKPGPKVVVKARLPEKPGPLQQHACPIKWILQPQSEGHDLYASYTPNPLDSWYTGKEYKNGQTELDPKWQGRIYGWLQPRNEKGEFMPPHALQAPLFATDTKLVGRDGGLFLECEPAAIEQPLPEVEEPIIIGPTPWIAQALTAEEAQEILITVAPFQLNYTDPGFGIKLPKRDGKVILPDYARVYRDEADGSTTLLAVADFWINPYNNDLLSGRWEDKEQIQSATEKLRICFHWTGLELCQPVPIVDNMTQGNGDGLWRVNEDGTMFFVYPTDNYETFRRTFQVDMTPEDFEQWFKDTYGVLQHEHWYSTDQIEEISPVDG